MKKGTKRDSPSLRQLFLRLILFRLILPLLIVELIVIAGAAYLGEKNLETQQQQIAESMAQVIDYHIDHGSRILDAVAKTAEIAEMEDLTVFMQSTWAAYGYFETLYYLDDKNKLILMFPSNFRYSGLEMSNIPDFKQAGERILIISDPFISLRTGDPTVYLIRQLNKGGCIVGELNLGMFQQDITNIMNRSDKDFVFIMDQAGTLLAHPSIDLVKQQANLSNLKIFNSQKSGTYLYNGTRVLGSIARAERTGWVVIDQAPISLLLHSYAWSLGVIIASLIVIWAALVWHLRRQIQKYVFNPLEQLSRETNALTIGDFSKANSSSFMPAAFAELDKLAADFQYMSNNLQIRENALRESKEAIQKANDELESKVEERTRDLKNANLQIIQQEKMASIGQLAAGVAHEINNPLGFIISNIDSLKKYTDKIGGFLKIQEEIINELAASHKDNREKTETDVIINRIHEAKRSLKIDYIVEDSAYIIEETLNGTGRIKDIVQDLRDFSRASLETSIADINKGIESVINIIWNEIKYKAVLTKELGDLPLTRCNQGQLNQVFLNLLLNAAQAIENQGQITVKTWTEGSNILISVADNGSGIPPEIQNRIFEPFFTTKEVGKGTGLGLSVSYGIVKKHNGTIEVDSTPGEGTTFTVKIPIVGE